MLSWTSGFKSAAMITACSSVLLAAVPAGWFLAGSRPADYDCSIDPVESLDGHPVTYLKSKPGIQSSGFGTLMQSFDAGEYVGKRVRFSAAVRSDGIDPYGTAWAGLWMRVDGELDKATGHHKTLAFDNMHDGGVNRSIIGATPYQNYVVVLDVPKGATGISFGILLHGSGAVWLGGVKFEVVGREVPTTNGRNPQAY